jgi:hypothetical protein
MMSKIHRQWLTPTGMDSDQSFVVITIGEEGNRYDSHDMTLGDCYKNVTFSFSTNPRKRKAMLRKLGKLHDALDIIGEALGDA